MKEQEIMTSALRIMEALGAVEEDLLERCNDGVSQALAEGENVTKTKGVHRLGRLQKPLWRYGRAWAACLCLLAVGIVSWGAFRLVAGPYGSASPGNQAAGGADGAGMEAIPMEQPDMENGMDAGGKEVSGEEADLNQGEEGGNIEHKEVVTTDSESEMRGTDEEGAREETGQDSPDKDGASAPEMDSVCGINTRQEITEDQARSSIFGSYIPTQLPAGYRFESGSASFVSEGGEISSMVLTWMRGMDYITIVISDVEGQEPDTVDVSRPETYDVRLYEIPYAESVPEAYRETVDHPVFALEDMSLEIVESRMKQVADGGDTDTPRGNFEVLYPEGVLVRFTGRGTPEEIWELFSE